MKTKPKIVLTCTACGKTIVRYECQTRAGARPFCSHKCLSEYRRNGSEIVCAQCGKQTYRRFGEQDRGFRERQFCSRECYSIYRIEHMKPAVYPKSGSIHIHRLIAETCVGRKLKPGEIVHHIDGDKHNSEPANLYIFKSQADHAAFHAQSMKTERKSK